MHKSSPLRDAPWFTRRLCWLFVLLFLLIPTIGISRLLLASHGDLDAQNRPLGTDFSDVYAAGKLAAQGRAADAFNPTPHYAQEQALFGAQTPFYGWHYPPYFLLLAQPLASLPYFSALGLWQAASFALYLALLALLYRQTSGMAMTDPLLWLAAAAYPAVAINLLHGQNGFLTAALLAGGLAMLPTRPLLAGVFFGLLCYKPHFALMLPLALLCGSHGRTIASALLTVLLLTLLSLHFHGVESWQAFAHFSSFTRHTVLEQGGAGWYKIQSLFAAVRGLGGSLPLAYAAQGALILTLAAWIAQSWRSALPRSEKNLRLCLAIMLAMPYSLDCDLMILAPALLIASAQARHTGFTPWEKSALALNFAAAFFARDLAQQTAIPLGFLAMAAWCLQRQSQVARPERQSPESQTLPAR